MNRTVFPLLSALAVILIPAGIPAQDDDRAARQSQRLFERADRNKDGRLSREELPAQLRQMFDRIDADSDGFISLKEDVAFRRERLARQRERQRGQRGQQRRERRSRVQPTHANISYGKHPRNVLDLYQAESKKPTPLVVYIHGGGFRGGDKRSVNASLVQQLRSNGVSVAAFNYRLTSSAPFPAQMHDCARALQFVRHHAKKYRIDPKRIGATGGSAGAGISQWLAFHEDLADPESKDPIARQSTRLTAIAPYNAQSSYDPRFIQKLFDSEDVEGALLPFFGMKSKQDIHDKRFHQLFEEASPINHATADDPPVLFFFSQRNLPLRENNTGRQHIHHPKFGIVMKAKLDKLGVECTILFRKDHPRGMPVDKFVAFFLEKFGIAKTKKRRRL
ncbi:MAG: alpha/beta hydrolase fold domain-containing protein [Planctomycetota bacterium]|jgi:acetyl esterase/lipase